MDPSYIISLTIPVILSFNSFVDTFIFSGLINILILLPIWSFSLYGILNEILLFIFTSVTFSLILVIIPSKIFDSPIKSATNVVFGLLYIFCGVSNCSIIYYSNSVTHC